MDEIVNRVANSGLLTINLEDYYDQTEIADFDMKNHLFQGLILREKDFRDFVKNNDWEQYRDKHVALFCSADAIVPTWAYMLVANRLSPIAKSVFFGNKMQLQQNSMNQKINQIDINEYKDQRVVIKGCSKFEVPVGAYVAITERLSTVAKSIMYGEPCSTVPIFKRS
ncbi:MAG: DUF2480 family protein [Flavobacteriales bacterium]|nr:DUF2480 family protein [Flavobacteriales bacterium]